MNSRCTFLFAVLALAAPVYSQARPAVTPRPDPTGASATPAPQVPTSVPSAPLDSSSYIIGADDVLAITVWKEPALTGPLTVRPDGAISVPLLGDVVASGTTPMQLAQTLTEKLKKYVNDPTVTVTVSAVNSKRVFLIGQVQRIGPVNITPGMTVLQAISSGGGLTPYANGKKVYILRGPQGAQKRIPFNYKTALRDGNQQGVVLQPGDTIVVP